MSQEERDKLEWLKGAKDRVISQREAAERIGISGRQWMMQAGLWKSKARRLEQIHAWRPRHCGFWELVQWDTSEHDWLDGRGPVRYLVPMIDDATSWSWGRFVERDTTPHNMFVGLVHRRRQFDVRRVTIRKLMPPIGSRLHLTAWLVSSDQPRHSLAVPLQPAIVAAGATLAPCTGQVLD